MKLMQRLTPLSCLCDRPIKPEVRMLNSPLLRFSGKLDEISKAPGLGWKAWAVWVESVNLLVEAFHPVVNA